MAKPKAKQAAVGDNSAQSEREMWEEQQFLNALRQIKNVKSNIALEMGDAKEIYERLKKAGFTKGDIKWALELEDKDAGDVIATMQRRIRIAKMLGHGLARQVEMFDTDRAPIEERAYDEGLAAGKLRAENANPYGADSPAGQAWQRGFNEGTSFINKELAAQFADEGNGSELIKAGGDDPFEDEPQREASE